ncbi:hypothetical protein NFO65_18480 [Neorhizobium galegae]|uniref:hypothetical protein n=1 Tax=Neorhizobium galegae TaxID=399 RepID=UPI0021019F75|nr:hypothetical protein [Neorhizobium galegae]MCQ1572719.1 hypothetical protein [Neorhizobium galegae]
MSAVPKDIEKDLARAELEDVLAYHDGNALAAVESLLADCRNLRGRLTVYDRMASKGYTRGWKPGIE